MRQEGVGRDSEINEIEQKKQMASYVSREGLGLCSSFKVWFMALKILTKQQQNVLFNAAD